MGTVNWDNLAEYAQNLLTRIDPDDLDEDTREALFAAAEGALPPPALLGPRQATRAPAAAHTNESHAEVQPLPSDDHPGQVETGTEQVHEQVHGQVLEQVLEQVGTGTGEEPSRESGRAASHLSTPAEKKCAAQNKRTGNPCRARPSASGYCVFHDPALTEAVDELRARGGRAPRRVLVGEARKLDFQVMDRGGIQALIAQVLRLQMLGVFTPRQASQTVKLIGHLVSNAREMSPSEETFETFEQATRALTDATDTVAHRLESRDLSDRVNAIQDVGSKREEILKANDRFTPRRTYRSARDYPR